MTKLSLYKIICYLAIVFGVLILIMPYLVPSLSQGDSKPSLFVGVFPTVMGLIGLSKLGKTAKK